MKKEFRGSSWLMSDAFWRYIQPLLPSTRAPTRRATTGQSATGDERHLLRTSHWLPVEGGTHLLWLRQHCPSLLSGVDGAGVFHRLWRSRIETL